jgi:hypothetical protein
MSYFSRFPYVAYTLDSGVTYSVVADILRRISVSQDTKENYSLYEEYTVKDGETPEIVSFKFYNDTQYHWVILLINDIIDPRFDWPLTEKQLYNYSSVKYGANISAVRYYTISNTDTTVVDPTQSYRLKDIDAGQSVGSDGGPVFPFADAYPVTNLDHEAKVNEEKRNIRVLRPKFLAAFLSEYEAVING